jgi:hypothetical protein
MDFVTTVATTSNGEDCVVSVEVRPYGAVKLVLDHRGDQATWLVSNDEARALHQLLGMVLSDPKPHWRNRVGAALDGVWDAVRRLHHLR